MTNEIWYLKIISFLAYRHFYGRLCHHDRNIRDIEVGHHLSAAEAKLLTEPDFTPETGSWDPRFLIYEQVIAAGIARFREIEGAQILLLGRRSGSGEPQRVLVGPAEFMRVTNSAYKDMEELGFYDGGHRAEATIVSDAWYAYFLDFREKL